jgi:16S rRNA (cytosine967-C5)-methyltransferase
LTPARITAFRILQHVERGAYAADSLYTGTQNLDPRDASLAEEIVFGVLRFQLQLDFLCAHYSGRNPARLDPEVLMALRMGIYQLRYLDRVPRHAAVTESVELVKRARKASAAGFVNAVLRKVNREPVPWPDRAVSLSHPGWLLERWDRQYGASTATAIAEANLRKPDTYIRVPTGSVPPSDAEPCPDVAGCYRLPQSRVTPFRFQDIGSQSIVPLLDLQPGQTFLDVCAAPGNKTAQALERGVHGVACDIHHHRLLALRELDAGLVVADAATALPFRRRFDRILLDAPCSGTGTLARNPEIKWRLEPRDLDDLRSRQRALLANAIALLAPGGRLVYSTCSLESEENDDVMAPYAVSQVFRRLPGRDPGDGFFAAVLESDNSPK